MKTSALFLIILAGCGSGGGGDSPVPVATPVVSERQQVTCPQQTSDTMVILAFGQSNAANTLEKKHSSSAINFHQGKCYQAQDPLIGPTGDMGSMWPLLTNKLHATVVLIPIAVGATSIAEWEQSTWLDDGMKSPYQITHFLWQQGEKDARIGTTYQAYADALGVIIGKTKVAFPNSKFYVSISSKCTTPAVPEIQAAQKSVIGPGVFQGPDTDKYGDEYRYDGCHFNEAGQEAITDDWVRVLVT